MRVVIDTNVVVSTFLSRTGASARVLDQWQRGAFALVFSKSVLTEYRRVLAYERLKARHGMDQRQIDEAVDSFRDTGILVDPTDRVAVIMEDEDDNRFLECVMAGDADFLISGDVHLLALKEYHGIQILAPSVFLAFLEHEGKLRDD